MSVRAYVLRSDVLRSAYVRPSTEGFFDFDKI